VIVRLHRASLIYNLAADMQWHQKREIIITALVYWTMARECWQSAVKWHLILDRIIKREKHIFEHSTLSVKPTSSFLQPIVKVRRKHCRCYSFCRGRQIPVDRARITSLFCRPIPICLECVDREARQQLFIRKGGAAFSGNAPAAAWVFARRAINKRVSRDALKPEVKQLAFRSIAARQQRTLLLRAGESYSNAAARW